MAAAIRSTSSSRASATCAGWAGPALVACLTLAIFAPAVLRPASASAQTGPPLKERFVGVDKNRDGKMDREEFHQAVVESFYFRDKDRNGYLVIAELSEASPDAFKAANRKGDGRLTLQEFVNALFIDYDRADTDKDGSLTFAEIEVYSRITGR
jgi:Ca2+-binding EF-hand superfamily protein